MSFEKDQLIDFLLGRGSKETGREIAQELRGNPEGDAALFVKAIQERARNALNIDWTALREKHEDLNKSGEEADGAR